VKVKVTYYVYLVIQYYFELYHVHDNVAVALIVSEIWAFKVFLNACHRHKSRSESSE